eukprot:10310405-Alexandrium_andersonii.AAC.1
MFVPAVASSPLNADHTNYKGRQWYAGATHLMTWHTPATVHNPIHECASTAGQHAEHSDERALAIQCRVGWASDVIDTEGWIDATLMVGEARKRAHPLVVLLGNSACGLSLIHISEPTRLALI